MDFVHPQHQRRSVSSPDTEAVLLFTCVRVAPTEAPAFRPPASLLEVLNNLWRDVYNVRLSKQGRSLTRKMFTFRKVDQEEDQDTVAFQKSLKVQEETANRKQEQL